MDTSHLLSKMICSAITNFNCSSRHQLFKLSNTSIYCLRCSCPFSFFSFLKIIKRIGTFLTWKEQSWVSSYFCKFSFQHPPASVWQYNTDMFLFSPRNKDSTTSYPGKLPTPFHIHSNKFFFLEILSIWNGHSLQEIFQCSSGLGLFCFVLM